MSKKTSDSAEKVIGVLTGKKLLPVKRIHKYKWYSRFDVLMKTIPNAPVKEKVALLKALATIRWNGYSIKYLWMDRRYRIRATKLMIAELTTGGPYFEEDMLKIKIKDEDD